MAASDAHGNCRERSSYSLVRGCVLGKVVRLIAVAALGSLLAGCAGGPTASIGSAQFAADEAPVVQGPAVRTNVTPLSNALTCLAGSVRAAHRPPIGIAVGDVKDYTGKFNQNEGNAVTQGGALMVYSALGKLHGAVRVHERFDTRIGEVELGFTDKRQLGDGGVHVVDPRAPQVPWMPYYGGSILASNYYIVGGITELNYNIQSGGVDTAVNGLGPKARVFTLNVAIDLRIVDTRSLIVVKSVSFQKQVTGYEVGLNIFRFFGSHLFDIDIGVKNQEPLQLGVRTALEYGVLDLVSSIARVDYRSCLPSELANGAPAPYLDPVASYTPPAFKPAPQADKAMIGRGPAKPPRAASAEPQQAPASEPLFLSASLSGADAPVLAGVSVPVPADGVKFAARAEPLAAASPAAVEKAAAVFIQVGVLKTEAEAQALLARVRQSKPELLARATSVTDAAVQNGAALVRARFIGLDVKAAQSACLELGRAGHACFVANTAPLKTASAMPIARD